MACRSIRASTAAVRQAWLDTELTLPQAAASVGMAKDALQARALALGLPRRRTGRREVIRPHQAAEFADLWQDGVAAREIGAHFGCSYFAVINTAMRLGLAMRKAGYRPAMTLAAWCEGRLAHAMANHARAENARLAGLRQ
ncbi:hypothetical protein [Ruixingdingia sedimenti]|uniref:Uncharacterized protein n=1 Tax=Ruixingdingia sedimenti TaxID=3073604 RepID=A0ABU1FEB1_9RHOB|nr:hypothetical protein [Xinfangfangia sp. LG-4]MDR5655231.1 hypothetical protein [Xinfangfangia sp. LG-4]